MPGKALGSEFTLKSLSTGWLELSAVEQQNAGKHFRRLLEERFAGQFETWTTSDNERHYRRR